MDKTNIFSARLQINGKEVVLETGKFAVQAAGAVTARCGDTIVLAAVTYGDFNEDLPYFPLQVEYREKHYAGGVISSSRFIKRESRPSDNEILTARLIDRSIRPLFPEGLNREVQVVVTPLSVDGENEPEMLAALAASAALSLTSLPWNGPLAIIRLGLGSDGKYIVNPTEEQKRDLKLNLIFSGTPTNAVMIEAEGREASEAEVLEAIKAGQEQSKTIVDGINELVKQAGKPKMEIPQKQQNKELESLVKSKVDIKKVIETKGKESEIIADQLVLEDESRDRKAILEAISNMEKDYVRNLILNDKVRTDDRKTDQIRDISVEVGLLPRTHGSAFFQRGLTHALSVVTLGSPGKEQLIEGMKGKETKRYMHHYNFPPFSTGETGRFGNPGRREIGHGSLAERALFPMIPSQSDFPYTIRVVSEVLSSNGSSSQASVCGSTLSLMDAGVPLKKPVAGIAMGVITDQSSESEGKDNFVILSDIAGLEDHVGDMDFKVAGTVDGITAIQMDIKVDGLSTAILEQALEQARLGRLHILGKMLEVIDKPRTSLSAYAPKIVGVKIDPEKIGEIIGPGGKVIRGLQEEYEVEIDISEDGLVSITGTDAAKVEQAKREIEGIVAEAESGKVYQGVVSRVEGYGCFVEILPGKSGLIHVSRLADGFLENAEDVVKVGDSLEVVVDEIDDQGRINLSPTHKFEAPQRSNQGQAPQSNQPRFYPNSESRGNDRGRDGNRRPQRPKTFRDHR
jgi:polyribonucleotide nucleotidyltransferase